MILSHKPKPFWTCTELEEYSSKLNCNPLAHVMLYCSNQGPQHHDQGLSLVALCLDTAQSVAAAVV